MIRLIYITIIALIPLSILAEIAPLRIALVGPFTGAYAAYGSQLLAGATQAAQDINESGGIKGVMLEIVPMDDQCNPDIAITQAEQIVTSKEFPIVIGHVCSSATLATANIYAKAKILVITPTATNPKITQRNIATLFRMTGNDTQQAKTAAKFIVTHLHSKRVAVLHDQDLYSKDLADQVSENLTQLNSSPILYQAIPRGARKHTALIKKIKQLKADAVYFAGLYPEVSSLAKTMHALDLQIPFITGDGIALQKFILTVDNPRIANSVLMTFTTDAQSLISGKNATHKMQQKHLETTGYALYAYATVQVIANAVEHTNQTEGTILADYLHQHVVDTVLGKQSWDTNGDIIATDFKIYTWNGNKIVESAGL